MRYIGYCSARCLSFGPLDKPYGRHQTAGVERVLRKQDGKLGSRRVSGQRPGYPDGPQERILTAQ